MDGENNRLPEQVSKSTELVHCLSEYNLNSWNNFTLYTAPGSERVQLLFEGSISLNCTSVFVQSQLLLEARVQFYASPSRDIPTHAGGVSNSKKRPFFKSFTMKGRGWGGVGRKVKRLWSYFLHHVFVAVFQYVPGPQNMFYTWSGVPMSYLQQNRIDSKVA